jgi:hypothetical protein
MANVLGHETEVYPDVRQGLFRLLTYALHPKHYHSRKWIKPLLTRLFTQDTVPKHRCTVCGKLAPGCRRWDRLVRHA